MVIVLWSDKKVNKDFLGQNILTLHILVVD